MSRGKRSIHEEIDFVARFIEICGTSRPAEIQRLLNVTYQAAKNYLNGRLPSTEVLISLANVSDYSLHWLLTGAGEKKVGSVPTADALLASDRFRESVREVCAPMIEDRLAKIEVDTRFVELNPGDVVTETLHEATSANK